MSILLKNHFAYLYQIICLLTAKAHSIWCYCLGKTCVFNFFFDISVDHFLLSVVLVIWEHSFYRRMHFYCTDLIKIKEACYYFNIKVSQL